jgi:dethiobiotin synthetase
MSEILIVSGTGTDVGKTIVTAAIASKALKACKSVSVVKPGQTGVSGNEPGDLHVVAELTSTIPGAAQRLLLHEYGRYEPALAPASAARISGAPALARSEVLRSIQALTSDLIVVEGAGGLLVRYSDDPAWTIADLAHDLNASVLLVVHAGLGTLHHSTATIEVATHRGLDIAGLIIGSWPDQPDLAQRSNVTDLQRLGVPLVGAIPSGSGNAREFEHIARTSLHPVLLGTFNEADFTHTNTQELNR